MFENFKAWCERCAANARTRFTGWFRRKKLVSRGRGLAGEHGSSSGRLIYAPMISPVRGYQLYFPTGYREDERLPLAVMLHGCKQDAESFAASTRFNVLADRDRYLVLYPEQPRRANPYRCWNWFDPSSHKGNGEVAIIAEMVRKVALEHNADSSRIYLAGLSAGGALASALASCHAEMFAACAIHSGMMFQAASSPAAALPAMRDGSPRSPKQAGEDAYELSGDKVHSMPVLVIHGDADETVHPINAKQIVAQFLAMNKDALARNTLPRTLEKSNGNGYLYETRDYGAEVSPVLRHITVKGMGHAWSGGNMNYPYNDARGPNASEMMLEFFALHRREKPISRHSELSEESAFSALNNR